MRRKYITPEYYNNYVTGTLNMLEESNFFGAKMLDIDDRIIINNTDLIWYQLPSNEQLDFTIESTSSPYFYSPSEDKRRGHKLIVEPSQSSYQRERNTKWVLEIDSKKILLNYLFATLKKYRTFEGIRNNFTLNRDVDLSIKTYIDKNISNRYVLDGLDLYLTYKSIINIGRLRYENKWDININQRESSFKSFQIEKGDITKITFEQINSANFVFDYYYDIKYKRI
jgi:hypothetical protein